MTEQPKGAAPTLGDVLAERGVSRRSFLKFASCTASIMALPPTAAAAIAEGLAKARRQSVIWLSFQECTGCTESITRAGTPSIEDLIFDFISLDYHHTLQNASGRAAEEARMAAMRDNAGEYIVVVDGSVPLKDDGVYSTIAGISGANMKRPRKTSSIITVMKIAVPSTMRSGCGEGQAFAIVEGYHPRRPVVRGPWPASPTSVPPR